MNTKDIGLILLLCATVLLLFITFLQAALLAQMEEQLGVVRMDTTFYRGWKAGMETCAESARIACDAVDRPMIGYVINASWSSSSDVNVTWLNSTWLSACNSTGWNGVDSGCMPEPDT